jgi:amino acid adenylation domain-containing protein
MQETTPETVGFRLSPQQEQLLLSLGEQTATVQCAAVLDGALDADRLREALERAAARHEILRTTFAQPAGMRIAQQVIVRELRPSWSTEDRSADDLLRDPAALAEVLEREAGQRFDLARGPLLRALLAARAGEPALLVLTASAACADPTSLLVLLEEMSDADRGDGAAAEEPIQHADYAEWRHELISGEEGEAQQGREFWLQDAADRPPAPRILFGTCAMPASGSSASLPVDLGAIELEALQGAASSAGVTVPVFLEGAWHALLARLSGAAEVLTASWLDGRAQPDLERAVGPYAQPAPVRSRIQEATSFAEVVDQVRRSRTMSARWQDCASAAELVALSEQARVGFAHLQIGLVREPVRKIAALDVPYAELPLFLGIRTLQTALDGELRYDPDAFDREDVIELAGRFAILLASAIADPAQPVSRLAILGGEERTALVARSGGGPEKSADASIPVHRQFEAQVIRTPDAAAVDSVSGGLSYAELNAAANRLAHHLRALGAAPGVPVGLCMERTPVMLIALLGILKQGGAYLPLNYEHPQARLAHQLSEAGARVLVTEEHLIDRLPEFHGTIVCVDRDAAAIAASPATNLDHAVAAEDLVYVMYTSGSTGTPKGVAVTQENLASYAAAIVERLGAGGELAVEGLRFGVVSAISTDLGNTSIFPPLISGGCVQLISAGASMDGDALGAELAGRLLDVIKITPSHLRALLAGDSVAVLPRRWLVLGGEALPWDLVERVAARAPEVRILNHYGPTETTVGCCAYLVDGDRRAESQTVPIGFPLAGARAYVLDEHLEPVPAGVPGELCIGGAGVARGYVGGENGSARFAADPFADGGQARMYRTGDRARQLRDGAIEFLGRLDEQVKIRGFRIEPGEIEAALMAHPAIQQAAVNAEDDGRGGLRLVAYLLAPEMPPVEALEAFLGQSLPDYMVPSAFATVEALPFTPSGKIDRKALAGLAEIQTRREAEYVAPRDEVEQQIAEIWRELLGAERVGVLDDFFALGGHSLLATQAIMRIRRLYGDIPLRALLAAPTVATLAEVVRAAGKHPEGQ